jgi:hypothetical protein
MAPVPTKAPHRPRQISSLPCRWLTRRQRNEVAVGWPPMGRKARTSHRIAEAPADTSAGASAISFPWSGPSRLWPNALRRSRVPDPERPDPQSKALSDSRIEQPAAGEQSASPARPSSEHGSSVAPVPSARSWKATNHRSASSGLTSRCSRQTRAPLQPCGFAAELGRSTGAIP